MLLAQVSKCDLKQIRKNGRRSRVQAASLQGPRQVLTFCRLYSSMSCKHATTVLVISLIDTCGIHCDTPSFESFKAELVDWLPYR